MKSYDVVLIGSGIASLTCAAILARKGRSVCVLENYSKPGGYLHGFRRFGIHFDTGAHYVGAMDEGQPFRALLEYLGVYDESLFIPLDPDGFDIMHFPNFKVEWPKGFAAVTARIQSLFPQEATAVAKFFAEVQQAANQFPTYRFQPKIDSKALAYYMDTTLAQVVQGLTQNEELKCVLYAHCALHGVRPEDVSFGLHSVMLDSFVTGAQGLRQGGDALAKKFVQVIEAAGGKVFLRKGVKRIILDGDQAAAVECNDGDLFSGSWIISGIHPKRTFALLSEQKVLRAGFRERLESLPESTPFFGVYARCTKDLSVRPRSNYFFFKEARSTDLFDSPASPEEPRVVFMNSADRDPPENALECGLKLLATGPYEWFEKWTASRVGHRGSDYLDMKKGYAEMIWKATERYMPGIKACRLEETTSTALTNLYFNGAPMGSGHGLYHSLSVTGARALGPRTKVKNLLITGQSTLFPGFLGAATSGLRAVGHIIGTKEVLGEVQGIQQ